MTQKSSSANISATEFNSRCQPIRKVKDILLGDCTLYKDNILKKTVLAKERIIKTETELGKQLVYYDQLLHLNECPYIAQFYYYTDKSENDLKRDAIKFLEVRQYVDHDLDREISCRLRDKDVLTETDMWKLTKQLIAAFAKLQALNLTHLHICPKNLTVSKTDHIQVALEWSNFHQSTYAQLIAGKIDLRGKCCLSPELLASLHRKIKNPAYNPIAADVFSLGMSLLAVCTLGDIDDLYNFKSHVINVERLKSKLAWVKEIYSDRMYNILSKMLKINAADRPDFISLEEMARFINKTGENLPGEHISPSSRILGRTPSPTYSPGFAKTLSPGRMTTMSGFELQKMRKSFHKDWSITSDTSGRNTADPGSTTTRTRINSPLRSPRTIKSTKVNPIALAKLHAQRAETVVGQLFDKKTLPTITEGVIPNDILINELEKYFLYDPLTKLLKTGLTEKFYTDGSHYQGKMKGKSREGFGLCFYKNNDVYAGEWKNDRFSGRGLYLFANGERYEGQLARGLKNGKGVFYYINKSKYIGDWKDDKKHGQGILYYTDKKEKYEGAWVEGNRQGAGRFIYASGDHYEGGWYADEKSGWGLLNYVNGTKYEGEWASNKPWGEGTMVYANGDRYEGNWVDGVKQGFGVYCYADGSRYEGEWSEDEKNGQGTLYHAKGEKYVGEWQDGMKQGNGTYYYADGGIYEGQWEKDFKQGQGSMKLSDGTHYEGEWISGRRNGKGFVTLANGDEYEGEFKDDMMHGQGMYRWANKDAYEGTWVKNMMHGSGKFYKKDGDHFFGIWESQRLLRVTTVGEE